MLLKSCPAKVKAVGDGDAGTFEAIVSVFGNVDSYGDRVVKGAFAKTLADWEASGNPIPVYWSHRMDDPDYNIGQVLEAEERDEGLWVKAQIDLDATKASQVYRLLKGARVTQFSFAYDVEDYSIVKDEDTGSDVYELRQIKLYEVGPTPIGANQETELLSVKSAVHAVTATTEAAKAGRVLSAKTEGVLRDARGQMAEAVEAIDSVLAAVENDQEKSAQPAGPAKDEEPSQAKSEEPSSTSPADHYLAVISIAERN